MPNHLPPAAYPLLILDFLLSMILFLPISDNRGPDKRFAIATIILIGLNTGIFVFTYVILPRQIGEEPAWLVVRQLALTPARVWAGGNDIAVTMVTSAFLHGDPLHLASNMFYLFFFGRKVEDVLGSIKFVVFYLACAFIANFGSIVGESVLPLTHGSLASLGASGAIMGVIGAYLFLYQSERIRTLPLLFGVLPIPWLPRLRVWFFIAWMIAGNVVSRLLEEQFQSVGYRYTNVDTFAHLGGLIAGLTCLYLFLPKEMLHFRYRPASPGTRVSKHL